MEVEPEPLCRHPIFNRPQDLDILVGTSSDKFGCWSSTLLSRQNVTGLSFPNPVSFLPHFMASSASREAFSMDQSMVQKWDRKDTGFGKLKRMTFCREMRLLAMHFGLPAIDEACRPSMRHCRPQLMAGRTLCLSRFHSRSFEPAGFHSSLLHTRVWRDEALFKLV